MNFFRVFLKFNLIFFCILFTTSCVLADDLYPPDDNFDISDVIESNIEVDSNTSNFPTINSRAYVVIDRKTNNVLVGKNENQRKKMASTTKIMTSLVIMENFNLSDVVEISKKAANTGGSRLGLKTGDKITVSDLLYGLMLRSGNDAAVALAEYTAGSINNFSELMNNKAKELGLNNTHFVTPHGLDEDEHYTTAYELALLSNYALNNPTFLKIVGTKNYTITINGYPKTLTNTNELLGCFNGIYGIKTGFTNGANRCLVTACKREQMDIICVVLGADTKKFRTTDSMKLLDYCFNNYIYVDIEKILSDYFENWKNNNLSSFNVNKGIYTSLNLKYEKLPNSTIPIKNEYINDLKIYVDCETTLNAPIKSGTNIGNITLEIDSKNIYSSNIFIDNNIEKKSVIYYLLYFFKQIN